MKLLIWAILLVICLIAGPIGWLVFGGVCLIASSRSWVECWQLRQRNVLHWFEQGCPLNLPILFCGILLVLMVAFLAWINQQPPVR